jgi:hypothetical protein
VRSRRLTMAKTPGEMSSRDAGAAELSTGWCPMSKQKQIRILVDAASLYVTLLPRREGQNDTHLWITPRTGQT